MFNPASYENSRADGIGVLEVQPPEEGAPPQFVPLKRTELRGEIIGPLAAMQLAQAYGYSAEQCDKTLEALYRFPLPGDAAVSHVRVRFGDVEIHAELKERERAEAEYAEAKQKGFQAVLATRESPDVFTLAVAGIQPGQEILVETSYVQLAKREGSHWTVRVPLTTSPRYVRSDELTSRHAQGQPLAILRDPGHRFSLELLLRGGGEAQSPTHALDVSASTRGLRVTLKEGEVLPDRDFVLRWLPAQEAERPSLQTMLHHDRDANHLYFMALVAPPATRDAGGVVAREVMLLVDHSGSMDGAKWEAADWTVESFLSGLKAQDHFNLGLFHNTTFWFAKAIRKAEEQMRREAIDFLKKHRDMGGTELGVALEQALDMKPARDAKSRHVLIVTDAEVSDEGRILRLADENAQQPDSRRISVICIDAAPNAFLANELADRGGGVARFLTSNPDEGDVTTALDEVLADWSEPILANLRLEIDRPGAKATGRTVREGSQSGWSAIDLGDLPAGRAIWVAGRVPRGESNELRFRVVAAEGHEVASTTLRVDEAASELPALKALFGARRVLGLEFLINSMYSGEQLNEQLRRLGYDPDKELAAPTKSKLYAENVRQDATGALKELLVREALEYGLASAETAFVAVRKEAGNEIDGTVTVANALPSGWSDKFVTRAASAGRVGGYGGQSVGYTAGAMPAPMSPPGIAPRMAKKAIMPRRADEKAKGGSPLDALARGISNLFGGGKETSGAMPEPAPQEAAENPADAPDWRGATEEELDDEVLVENRAASGPALFAGTPQFVNSEALLFDSTRGEDNGKLPGDATLTGLTLRFPDGTPDAQHLDSELAIHIFLDDLSAPRARVRLADLVRQGGKRPLNLRRQAGQVVRLVLVDPNGAWASGAPSMEVSLEW
ncbi:MAG: VWA domain-containing protein [Ardenticatenales bacterium]|nr:VWA domain-containing protein [Ardenticatenales bacterium]